MGKKTMVSLKTEEQNGLLFTRRRLFSLLWPLVVEQLLTVLVGMIDVLMVSFLGEAAVSGVSLVDSLNHLVIQVLFALTTGGTVICAKAIGAGDFRAAGKAGAQMMLVTVGGMLCLSLAMLFGRRWLLGLFFGSVDSDVMDNALRYMLYTAISFPFLAAYYAAAAAFRAKGNTRIAMLASLGMNVLNIIGNAICIFALHMGVEGVAVPTLLSRMAAAVAMVLVLQRPANDIRIRSFAQLQPDRKTLGGILSIGIPNSLESGLFNVGKILLQSLVSTLGTSSIAAYAVASNLATYLYLPGNALGAGMTTVVSQCIGAGDRKQAKANAKRLIGMNYAMLLVFCGAMILGRSLWVGLYHLSPYAALQAERLIFAHSAAMIRWPVGFLLPYYFRAAGRPMFTMAVSLLAMALLRIGLAYLFILGMHKDVLWVWIAMFADWLFRVVVYGSAFLREPRAV